MTPPRERARVSDDDLRLLRGGVKHGTLPEAMYELCSKFVRRDHEGYSLAVFTAALAAATREERERLAEVEKWAKRWAGRMILLHEAWQDKDPNWEPKDETVIGLLNAVKALRGEET